MGGGAGGSILAIENQKEVRGDREEKQGMQRNQIRDSAWKNEQLINMSDIVLVLRCPGCLNFSFQALARSKPITALTGVLAGQNGRGSDDLGDMGEKVSRV